MKSREKPLSLLDPYPGDAAGDKQGLLRRILASPAEPRRRRMPTARRLALPVGGVAVTLALAAALLTLRSAGAPESVLAKAAHAVSEPGTILHYRVRQVQPAASGTPYQDLGVTEVWQTSDGAHVREIRTPSGDADGAARETEQVHTRGETLTWSARAPRRIALSDSWFGTPPTGIIVMANAVGDPATLLERAEDGDVVELGEAKVRGIAVHQFRVGECEVTASHFRYAQVVSIRRDNYLPVQVEQPPCGPAFPNDGDPLGEGSGTRTEFLSFEVLDATDESRALLQMREHPGAQVTDVRENGSSG